MSGEGKLVCVTGGSGYIASWLIILLLQHGYTVRATACDPDDVKKTEHLLGLPGANERLQLFKTNLLEERCFDAVVDGCEGVFHTASPVIFCTNHPQGYLIEPTVNRTLNVLRSCAKCPSIKRVIATSSMASVIFNGRSLGPDVIVDENWHSDIDFCKKKKFWYMVAKTLAEETAWKFAIENAIDVVTLHPGWVIVPILQPTLNVTVEVILKLINGAQTFPNETRSFVDVKDVWSCTYSSFRSFFS